MTSYMIKYITISLLFFSSPVLSKSLNSLDVSIPSGWKLISTTTGDLNKDGVEDAVLVLEEINPANLKPNKILEPSVLNVNPRRLLVLLKTHGAYREILSKDSLLPSANDEDSPCLDDPLIEQGGISIRNGKLAIRLGTFLYCGSYGVNHRTFTFRLEKTRFRLIGYDYSEFSRSSGEASECSINYLTGKKKIITGLNYFFEERPKVLWSRISGEKTFYLDEISFNFYSNDGYSCDRDR